MKEYLFRGKRKDNGEWIEGFLLRTKWYLDDSLKTVIIPADAGLYPRCEIGCWEEVIPETVGMYIQRSCYNPDEIKIFEGDIIEVSRRHKRVDGVEESSSIVIAIDEHSVTEFGLGRCFPQDTICVIKVIGNVHDNPELVGEKTANLYKYYNCLGVEGGK